ncbi:MAG TPA: tetratricopeptide repeat protein [Bryobacteraceae bacterium]|nr:tetratricopeptide repeat protein [Bryobacteraceae bacterium]
MASYKTWLLLPILSLLIACDSDPRAASRKYLENGNTYFSKGKYKEASLLYRRALKKDARFAEAWHQLGLANNQLGNYADARKDFARAMDLDPADTDAMVRLGDLDLLFYAADQKGNKELLADLKDLALRLLKKDKQSYDGLRFSGELALIGKDLKTAIQRFEAANQARPYQRELVLALAQALQADGREQRAEELAEETIEHDKAAGAIYDLLYTTYLRRHQPELAEEILQKKIADNPREGAYLMQLAFHYFMTDRRPEMQATLQRLTAAPAVFPDARLQVGDFYARIREFDRALAEFELGEKENPKIRRVYQKKSVEVLASQGRSEPAAGLLNQILGDDPKDTEALALKATLGIARGDPQELRKAISELEPLARKMAANPLVHYNLGRAYMASGPAGLEQAGAQFTETLRIDPRHTAALLGLAEVELARGETAQAVAQAEQVLSRDPANLSALLLRAQGWMKMAEYAKARADLSRALAMNPKSSDARFELGQLDLSEERFEEAEGEFQALTDAGDARGLTGAVDCRVRQGRWGQAVQIIQQQLAQEPNSERYRLTLANLLLRAGKYDEAAAQFQMLLKKNPNSEPLYLGLGEARAQLGDVRSAVTAFESAGGIAPADAAPDLALGILYDRLKRFREARQAYEAALAKQPDSPRALNNLAYLEAEQGVDLDQALAYAQHARAKLPDDVNVLDTLGLIYIKKNLTEDGFRMLREAVKRQPGNAAFRLHLALAWYQKGDRLMARRELEAARRNKPSDSELSTIQELLAKVG